LVWAVLMTKGRQRQTSQFLTMLDMPPISQHTWKKAEGTVTPLTLSPYNYSCPSDYVV
jgi:hypothetical protein